MTRIARLVLIGGGMLVVALASAGSAQAQSVGTFRWQQQPYCNVFTLSVTQVGASYRLDGSDDQCGAGRRAATAGIAVPNPDGSIGMGLTVVTSIGANPAATFHLDVAITLATVSGTWRDDGGHSGAWTFLAGGSIGGTPRPAPALAPGIVTAPALAAAAVTSDKIAPASITADKLAPTAFAGQVFAGIVGILAVADDGTVAVSAGGATPLTATRTSTGNYLISWPGLNAPGCPPPVRHIFSVVSVYGIGVVATTSASSASCATGTAQTLVQLRTTGGTLVNSPFNAIVFVSGS